MGSGPGREWRPEPRSLIGPFDRDARRATRPPRRADASIRIRARNRRTDSRRAQRLNENAPTSPEFGPT